MLWSVWVPIQTATTPGLRAALQAKAVQSQVLIQGGTVSKSTSNGHVTELATFGDGQFTAAEIADGWVYLTDLFDVSAAEVGVIDGSNDVAVEAQMEANLRPIVNVTSSFMYISK